MYTDGRRKVACNFRNGQMRKRKNSKGKLVSLASCDLLFHVSYLSISILPSSCFFLFLKIVSIIDFYERSGGVYSDTFLRKFLKEEQYLSPNTWIQISRFFAREGENLDGSILEFDTRYSLKENSRKRSSIFREISIETWRFLARGLVGASILELTREIAIEGDGNARGTSRRLCIRVPSR